MIRRMMCAACLLLLASGLNAASISLELESSLLTSVGEDVVFAGTIRNIGSTAAFLNGTSFTSPLPLDDTPFFLNFPAVLEPGESQSGPLFEVAVAPGTPLDLYVGNFGILGGDSATEFDLLATTPFGVQVVPEPATVWFAGVALAGLVLRMRRFSK